LRRESEGPRNSNPKSQPNRGDEANIVREAKNRECRRGANPKRREFIWGRTTEKKTLDQPDHPGIAPEKARKTGGRGRILLAEKKTEDHARLRPTGEKHAGIGPEGTSSKHHFYLISYP